MAPPSSITSINVSALEKMPVPLASDRLLLTLATLAEPKDTLNAEDISMLDFPVDPKVFLGVTARYLAERLAGRDASDLINRELPTSTQQELVLLRREQKQMPSIFNVAAVSIFKRGIGTGRQKKISFEDHSQLSLGFQLEAPLSVDGLYTGLLLTGGFSRATAVEQAENSPPKTLAYLTDLDVDVNLIFGISKPLGPFRTRVYYMGGAVVMGSFKPQLTASGEKYKKICPVVPLQNAFDVNGKNPQDFTEADAHQIDENSQVTPSQEAQDALNCQAQQLVPDISAAANGVIGLGFDMGPFKLDTGFEVYWRPKFPGSPPLSPHGREYLFRAALAYAFYR